MSIEFEGKRVDGVVLDFNGTFYIQNKEFQQKVWKDARLQLVQKTFEADGRPSPNGMEFGRRLQNFVEESLENGWRNTFKKYGGNNDDFDAIINGVPLAEYLEFDQEIVDFIRELMKHVPVHIFSSSHIDRILNGLEVIVGDLAIKMEDRILSGNKMKGLKKPNKSAFIEMMEQFELDPESTIYADNNWREADVAAELGMMTFLVDPNLEGIMNNHIVINYLAQMREHLVFIEDNA